MALSGANLAHIIANRPAMVQILTECVQIVAEEHGTLTTATLTTKLKGRGRGTTEITADISAIKGLTAELS